MLKFSKLAEAAHQSGAMEAETISKNGASSKSHTSRRNLLKTASVALLAGWIAFSGCKKEPEFDTSNFDGTIVATVVGGKEYNSKISKVTAYAFYNFDEEFVSASYANGGFTMTFPNSPAASFLMQATQWYDGPNVECTYEGSVVPKITLVDYFGVYNSADKKWVYRLSLENEDGDVSAVFMYADMDVTVEGTDENEYIKSTYDMTLKRGWNIVFRTQKYSATGQSSEKLTTKVVGGLSWWVLEID